MKNIEKIKPSGIFTNYIYKAIPLAFDESMSYYETLCGVLNLLKDQEIIVNNNADALKELQDYVTHYFDNLDVQEEINNKLDQMVESGTLQEIITQYLQINGVLSFNTINDMINATNIENGSTCKTLGYHSINDGGEGIYKIRNITNQDVVDGGSIIALNDKTLIAELISYEVNFMQFGAYGDGIHNDTLNIQTSLNYARNNNLKVTSPKDKIYLINDTINFEKLYVNLNNATIKANSNINMIELNSNSDNEYTLLENIIIDCNNIANIGLYIYSIRRCKINNINVINLYNIGIDASNYGFEIIFNNINIQNNNLNTNTIGFNINTSDNHYNDICMTNISTAFKIANGSNIFNNIHCWIGDTSLINNSKMFEINLSNNLENMFKNIYSDTYQYTFDFISNSVQFTYIDELTVRYNKNVYLESNNDAYIFNCLYDTQTKYINITNALIIGLLYNDISKTYFTNRNYFEGNITNYEISHSNFTNVYELLNINSNLTVERKDIKLDGKIVTLDLIASYDSSISSNPYINFTPACIIPEFLTPEKAITSSCLVSDSRWQFYEAVNGYLYLASKSETNKELQLRVPSGNTTKYIFVHLIYTI